MDTQSIYHNWQGMRTQRLCFRQLTLDDKEAIFHYASDPEVTQYVLFPTHRSMDDTINFIQMNLQKYANHEIACWGVALNSNSLLIGTADFVWWSPEHRKAEVGYCFAKEYWNQGYATEALQGLISFGFEYMDLNRIEARCFEVNKASSRVMEKAGMSKEGLLRESLLAKGRIRNIMMYSILQREYKQKFFEKRKSLTIL